MERRGLEALALLRLTRVGLAAPTLLPFVIGLAAAGDRPSPARWLGILAAGLLLHTIACTVNDIADRQSDRLDPRRADRPMVAGTVSVRVASTWATAQTAAFCVTAALLWRGDFLLLALGLSALSIVGDAIRKHTLMPPLWDLLFGVDMAGCVLLGARSWHGTALGLAFCYGIACTLFDTAAAGLKDLRWDQVADVRTSAKFFGARVDDLGRFHLPAAYRAWVGVLVGALLGGVIATGFLLADAPGPACGAIAVGTVGAVLIARGLDRRDPTRTIAAGAGLCLLPALTLAMSPAHPATLATGLAGALLVPVVLARGAAAVISLLTTQRTQVTQ